MRFCLWLLWAGQVLQLRPGPLPDHETGACLPAWLSLACLLHSAVGRGFGTWSPVGGLRGRGRGQVGLGVMAVEVGRGLREALP